VNGGMVRKKYHREQKECFERAHTKAPFVGEKLISKPFTCAD
jgi:hypothetical protein